jgi:hypothetical protein
VHGQSPHNLDEKLVDNGQSYRWLKFGVIKGETECAIVVPQGQAVRINYLKNKILKEEIVRKCRLCKEHEEIVGHLISGCPVLANNEYLVRHGKVTH